MSSNRTRSGKPSSRGSKVKKNNNIQLFKLLDPIGQSIFFVFFLYTLDAQNHFPYKRALFILVTWQLVSVIINFFLVHLKQLRLERLLYLVTMVIYLVVFFYLNKHVKENFVALDEGLKANVPIHQVIIMTVGMIIAFWYNVICYREFRSEFGAINRGKK